MSNGPGNGARRTVDLLCEDRLQESLVRDFCKAAKLTVGRVFVAPSALGAASAWVVAQYRTKVAAFRSIANAQPNRALLVVIDGDNVGITQRKAALDARGGKRTDQERIAIWVPTWSVETWLRYLTGVPNLNETQSYKLHPKPGACIQGAALHSLLMGTASSSLASLADAQSEVQRLLP